MVKAQKTFIVDTAATTSVVFENAVVSSSVEPSGLPDIKLLGLSGIQQAATFRVGSIDVGGRSLEDHISPILPDWNNFERTPQGVLGLDYFDGLVVVVDPISLQIRLYEAAKDDIEELSVGWRVAPLKKQGLGVALKPFFLVDVFISKAPTPFLLDTGSRSTLCNFPAVSRLQTIPQITAPNRDRATVSDIYSAEIQAYVLRKYAVDLGVAKLPARPILVADTPFFDAIGYRDNPFGVLGLDHLLQQPFAIDFPGNQLFIRRMR